MSDSDEAIRARLEITTIRDRDLDREIGTEWQAVELPKLPDATVLAPKSE